MFNFITKYLPDRLQLARLHLWCHGELRFFFFPRTFNELLNRNKLDSDIRLRALTADKYGVREYVAERAGPQYLIPLVKVLDQVEDLRFDELPDAFILKAAHGSAMSLLVRNKAEASEEEARALVQQWLELEFSDVLLERHYHAIPHRVVIEHLLLDEQNEPPADCKLFVFHGKVALIQMDRGRFQTPKRNFFTADWREVELTLDFRLPPGPGTPRETNPIAPPKTLAEMIVVAQKLAEPFPFARVDLYEVDGRVYFGEITHTPSGGMGRFHPRDFDRALGDIWRNGGEIPEKYLLHKATS